MWGCFSLEDPTDDVSSGTGGFISEFYRDDSDDSCTFTFIETVSVSDGNKFTLDNDTVGWNIEKCEGTCTNQVATLTVRSTVDPTDGGLGLHTSEDSNDIKSL